MNKILASCIAVIIPVLCVSFFSVNSYAAWAAFYRVTPENINEQLFRFHLSKVDFSDKFKATLDDKFVNNGKRGEFDLGKSAWLVITKVPLSVKEQNLQRYFGSSLIKNNPNILVFTKIGYTQNELNKSQLEVTLSKAQLNTAYIFVGYDGGLSDGGLRYTIDLKSFYMDHRLRKH